MKRVLFAALVITALLLSLAGTVAAAGSPSKDIERGVFVDHGYSSPPYSSPPWYPPAEETDSYQWAPRCYWDDPSIDVTVYTKDAPVDAFDAVTPAFAEWDGNTSTTIYGTVSEDTSATPPGAVLDEENTMSWDVIDGPRGIIAVCYYWYWVNTKELIEFDIVFDKDEIWLATDDSEVLPKVSDPEDPYPATGQFDVWNIATHELGHTLVLGDLRSPKDGALTMHAYTWTGDAVKRTLGSGDILGIQAIYGE